MKRKLWLVGFALVVLAIALTCSQTTTLAQNGGTYDLTWNSIDGGGGILYTGGTFSMGGAIGQADAGIMSGGSYSLAGGFWNNGLLTQLSNSINLYLPFVMK